MDSALEIESGQELLRFDLGTVKINGQDYQVLTGYEGTGRCFWCDGELKGKLKRYCRGHMKEYYRHFLWSSARTWCIERQEGKCANCGSLHSHWEGQNRIYIPGAVMEVHHIMPIDGGLRFFTAFNLPWNLIGFCHVCHQWIHAVMRGASKPGTRDPFDLAVAKGQAVFEILRQ